MSIKADNEDHEYTYINDEYLNTDTPDPYSHYEHLRKYSKPDAGQHITNLQPQHTSDPTVRVDPHVGYRRPPWWAWLLVLIGLVLIAGLAAVLVYVFLILPGLQNCTPCTTNTTRSGVYHATTQEMQPTLTPSDCQALYNDGQTTSGVYTISPDGERQMTVYCEQRLDSGGWTVFQQRQNGRMDFFRNWADYKTGFGDPSSEFWLGNDNIHALTFGRAQKLKVELRHPNGQLAYADYVVFLIENEVSNYRLRVTGFTSGVPPGDSMERQNGQAFSTYDRDNDVGERHCAMVFKGGWWYADCHNSNLNGIYGSSTFGEGINWYTYAGHTTSLTSVRMMVKGQ